MQVTAKEQQTIPTIRQVHSQLKDSYNQLDQAFKDIGIIPLSDTDDLQFKKITLKKILASIPGEQELTMIKDEARVQTARQCLARYQGNNQMIRKAKQNFNQLKREQQTIYYLCSQCKLPSVSPQFKPCQIPPQLQHLQSFKHVTEIKKTRSKILEKNTICDIYFEEGQAELDKIQGITIIKSYKKNQQLKILDMLIHVSFYDSHNAEKQYQFICVQEVSLALLVDKFKCLIDTLISIDKLRKRPEGDLENYQIYDKMYQGSSKLKHQLPRYLIIEDTIYYEGNKTELQYMLSTSTPSISTRTNIKYRFFELSKTKISDIRVMFGKPYIYRHLQGCDHIVIFKQGRLFHGNHENQHGYDITNIERYPLTIYESKMKRRKCQGCNEYFADFVVIGDKIKNGENFYVCQMCWQELGESGTSDKVKIINYVHD